MEFLKDFLLEVTERLVVSIINLTVYSLFALFVPVSTILIGVDKTDQWVGNINTFFVGEDSE
jgi:hypothetical protein